MVPLCPQTKWTHVLIVVGLDPQKIENKIQIKSWSCRFVTRQNKFLKVSYRVVFGVGSGSGRGRVGVDGVEVGKVNNVADVDTSANANA